MIAVLGAALVGFLSALLPFTPAEPYLIAAVTTTSAPAVALGMAAAAGQTAGKIVMFLAVRGAIRSPWLQHRLNRILPTARVASPHAPGQHVYTSPARGSA
ncbi:hypothetical protein [Actinoplanes sp. NPDC051859]|uniref:hypothetical protein n=1 Tax=Actinoplanes sp. NPDC051859 TaxID=3363909 RepID=UPI00379E763E